MKTLGFIAAIFTITICAVMAQGVSADNFIPEYWDFDPNVADNPAIETHGRIAMAMYQKCADSTCASDLSTYNWPGRFHEAPAALRTFTDDELKLIGFLMMTQHQASAGYVIHTPGFTLGIELEDSLPVHLPPPER